MNGSDILLTITIISLFTGMIIFNIITVEMAKVRKNWPVYRCNPVVMPLASQLGPPGTNVAENFQYCIQNMQSEIMDYFLQPLQLIISVFLQIIEVVMEALASLIGFFSELRTILTMLFGSIFGIIFNSAFQIILIVLKLEDILHRMGGTIFASWSAIETTGYALASMVNASANVISHISINPI